METAAVQGVRLVPVPLVLLLFLTEKQGTMPLPCKGPQPALLATARRGWEAPGPSPGSWEDVIGEAGD